MIELIDANLRLGRGPNEREGAVRSLEETLRIMDNFRVSKAVAYHAVSQFSDAMLGNDLLVKEAVPTDRFYLQWVVAPTFWDQYPKPREWLDLMKKNGVTSVRLLPAQYLYSMKRYAMGGMMDLLAQAKIPAFIPFDQFSCWDDLYDLLTCYPENRFVLTSPGYRSLRGLIPIMDNCKNLQVETSDFLIHDGIRDFCRFTGADRLLFGSGLPEASLAASASQLLMSDISEK